MLTVASNSRLGRPATGDGDRGGGLERMKTTSAIVLAALVWSVAMASPQTPAGNAADAALVDRARAAVLKELRDSGALDRAIDAGIERYVERQRAQAQQLEMQQAGARAATMRPVSRDRDHIRGDPAAPVTIVEYSDFECPFCKRFHPTLKRAVDESKGQVRWVYRHLPLDDLHPVKARKEAVAAECAAELGGHDAFWRYADRLFELTFSNNRTDVETVLPRIAGEMGLDKARFASCIADGRHDRHISDDVQEGFATGGRGTPWTLIVSRSGRIYQLSGAQPYAAVKQLIEQAQEGK